MKLDVELKAQKADHDSFVEFARLKDGYLFDEVAIKSFAHQGLGVEVKFTYTRHGVRIQDLDPVFVSTADFAEARTLAAGDKAAFGKTRLVERLFADGARQYNTRNRKVEEDFLADMSFIESLKQ